MITVPGFETDAMIHESSSSVVYRARRADNGQAVILKMLKKDYPTPEEILRYRQEHQILCALKGVSGVISVHGLEKYRNTLVIILEDFGAESLKILMGTKRFTVKEWLGIAVRVTEVLERIHAGNIMHKDINPSNIVLNPVTNELKMIDFGISTVLSSENAPIRSPAVLEATLAYVSPEQTGRMNRSIDYRTDYYSLGVTLYELLTEKLPFQTHDALEMVHCHIARMPDPPHDVNSEVPQAVSGVVMKLMAKNAEDRYQSSRGIRADLDECLKRLDAGGVIRLFELAAHDVPERFRIPQKLYGRQQELRTLMDAFDRVTDGRKEMTVVSGRAGIGKTSLVREIYKPVTYRRGYFISGKFDRFQRRIPYSAVVKAFRDLVRQLLTETEEQLTDWRQKLLAAFGPNGQIVIDVIPEVELIVGPQPPVPELPPAESQNRFALVFQEFIRVFCRHEHPLVVFMDDLQWADSASLRLLELIMTDQETRFIFLIVASRDNEVSPSDPVVMILDTLRRQGAVVNTLALGPLTRENVIELTRDCLHRDPEDVRPLAELLEQKTGGNPFFVNEFLKSLYSEKLLAFDFDLGGWLWDYASISSRSSTDNVVELMAGKIQKLSQDTQVLLQRAACIGNQFELNTLAIVCDQSPRDSVRLLQDAVTEGLVVPIGNAYKSRELDVPEMLQGLPVEYKFSHDRIQQAAYSLIPEQQRPHIHLRAGQLMLRNTASGDLEERVFDVVNQLNFGSKLIEKDSERYELAELNLMAGRKALASTAYEPAFEYMKAGIGLLGGESWQTHYKLTLALHVGAAEAAYLCVMFDEMERLVSAVLEHGQTILDKVKAYEVRIQSFIARNKRMEAVKTALPVLRLLGVRFPDNPTKVSVLLGFLKTKSALWGKSISSLKDLPRMTDSMKLAAMRILARVASGAYTAVPDLFPLIIFEMVRLSLAYGSAPESPIGYSALGIILCGIIGDFDSGYQFGNVALSLVDQMNVKEYKPMVSFIVNSFVKTWKEHVDAGLKPLLEAYQSGLEVGDLEYAALSSAFYCTQAYAAGKELVGLDKEMTKHAHAIGQLKQQTTGHLIHCYRQAVLNLMGRSENPVRLVGEAFDEDKTLPLLVSANERAIVFITYLQRLILRYLFHDYGQAVEDSKMALEYSDGTRGTITVALNVYYDSLVHLALWDSVSRAQRREYLRRVANNQKRLRRWALHAPMNYGHKFDLVEAERNRVLGRNAAASDFYDRAIELARANEALHDEALAYELAARFYLKGGKELVARTYLREARYCYFRWGARSKVRDLEQQYSELLRRPLPPSAPLMTDRTTVMTATTSNPEAAFDVATVIKASQAISSEIVMSKLLDELLRIVMESAGARRAFLILEWEGKLLVEAHASVDGQAVSVSRTAVETCQELSAAIVTYTARTGETIVLNDASAEGDFVNDPYVLSHRPRSVLCMPLIRHGKLTGVLYLENNLTAAAFTPDRLEILRLLSSQAAISIENARLYERQEDYSRTLEQKVNERTAALDEAKRLAERANRIKSEFLTNMSHELRTPLNAVIGFSEILEDQAFGTLNDKQMRYVSHILNSGRHLLQLINDILDLSKVESGKMELHPSRVNLEHLLASSLVMIKEKAMKHRLKLDLKLSDELVGMELEADEIKLKQIMFNLLSNATKFTPDGGAIGVEATRDGHEVVVKVWDTGIGVKPQDRDRIFGPFEQVDSSYARRQEGTGLGLALSKRLVELHGGRIWVESQGAGSTFVFTVPTKWSPLLDGRDT